MQPIFFQMKWNETNQKMKLLKTLKYPLIILSLLVISSFAFKGCRPDDVIIENNGELCDTCVIAYSPVISSLESTSVLQL